MILSSPELDPASLLLVCKRETSHAGCKSTRMSLDVPLGATGLDVGAIWWGFIPHLLPVQSSLRLLIYFPQGKSSLVEDNDFPSLLI